MGRRFESRLLLSTCGSVLGFSMAAKDAIRRRKTELQDILCLDPQRILDRVYETSDPVLITQREYRDLKDKDNVEAGLVDRIMDKGEDTCKRFVDLLQTDEEIRDTFPDLKKIEWDIDPNPLKRASDDTKQTGGPVHEGKRHRGDQDELTSNPTGVSVHINIVNNNNNGQNNTVAHGRAQKKPRHADGNDNTVSGFVHRVTEIQTSKKSCRYFNAVIQTDREEFHRAVIFSPAKHSSFSQAADNSTPVKLSRIKKSWSTSDDTFDILVSDISFMVETTVPFIPKPPTASVNMDIAQVLKMGPKEMIGRLQARVICIKDGSHDMIKSGGEDQEIKECVISDATGQVVLRLWNSQISRIAVNSCYDFSNVSTRRQTEFYLTCTKRTSITPVADLEIPRHLSVPNSVEEPLSATSGRIRFVRLTNKMCCEKCDKSQKDIDPRSVEVHRCERCELNQRVESYASIVSGTVVLTTSTGEVDLTVPPSPLTAYLTSGDLLHLSKDTDELEKHFLVSPSFDVVYNASNLLTKIQKTSAVAENLRALADEPTTHELKTHD